MVEEFEKEKRALIARQGANLQANRLAHDFIVETAKTKYSYHFSWLGRPIIQFPQDMIAMQEIIWSVRPQLIIETGIAHGGSLIYYSSLLELNAQCGGPKDAQVLGIDIDIRRHNRSAIEAHPLSHRIKLIEGSSVAPEIIGRVRLAAHGKAPILVCLDSNHTHAHVLAELAAYASMTTMGSYCVVFDTVIEDMPVDAFPDRPWAVGNNPKTAVNEFLNGHPEFQRDTSIQDKLLITVAPGGYLRRVL